MDPHQIVGDRRANEKRSARARQADIWTAIPGIIESFDPIAMTCVVQPAVKAVIFAQDGTSTDVALPLLLDCPVQFQGGGGFTATFPITAGDECLVVFSSRCIDAWWYSGGVQSQAEMRMHDLSDGFVLPGVRSQPRVISGISTSAAQLRSDDGATFVEVGAGEVKITATTVTVNATTVAVNASASATITSPITTVAGDLVINGSISQGAGGSGGAANLIGPVSVTNNVTAGGISLDSHHHTGVQTGSGNTGGPA